MKFPFLICLAIGCVRAAAPATGETCADFSQAVKAFDASLLRPADGPPASDPNHSPALARSMVERGARCLEARGVAYERTVEGLWLKPTGPGIVAPVAGELDRLTGGRAIYSGEFFVEQPYAAASFDKGRNTLFLPHAAILGDLKSVPVAHELRHASSLALLRAQVRPRHWLLKNENTRPGFLSIDEIFAYAAVSTDLNLPAAARERSAAAAHQYAEMAASALVNPATVCWVETHPPSEARPFDDAQRTELRNVLACINAKFPAIEACDAPE